jgi:hypothetical protein
MDIVALCDRFRPLAVLCLVLLTAACGSVGRDFPTPANDEMTLGQMTPTEAFKRFGEPFRKSVVASSGGNLNVQTTDERPASLRPAAVEGVTQVWTYIYTVSSGSRSMLLTFWNDRLVFYNFASNFSDQSTNFEEGKVSEIRRGSTTYADVVALLGKPSGQGVFPVVATRGHRLVVYQSGKSNSQTRTMAFKRLELAVDARDVVVDYYLYALEQPTQANPVPQRIVIPLILPIRR